MVNFTSYGNRPPTADALKQINSYKQGKAAPFGGNYQAYLDSIRPPTAPSVQAQDDLYNVGGAGGQDNDVGDRGYEAEEIHRTYADIDKQFLQNNPQQSELTGGSPMGNAVRAQVQPDPTPAPVINTRPQITPQQPQAQQPQQATALRDFSSKPNPNSSWQTGGWS